MTIPDCLLRTINPTRLLGRLLVPLIFVGLLFGSLAPMTLGQLNNKSPIEEPAEKGFSLIQEGTRPLMSLTFASANRFVDESRYIFDVGGNPDAFKVVEDWLSSTMNNLEGFNRDNIPKFPTVFFRCHTSLVPHLQPIVRIQLGRAGGRFRRGSSRPGDERGRKA